MTLALAVVMAAVIPAVARAEVAAPSGFSSSPAARSIVAAMQPG
ncbi:hypothetical protein [Saccharothrix deserti]|nr:hypothetical protein [Saccharothrix deserti]